MRDYIVTHATKSVQEFTPRVVRAASAADAIRATVVHAQWHRRRITRSRHPNRMLDPKNYGSWYCNGGTWHRDTLDVAPFFPSHWTGVRLVRINRRGAFVGWLNTKETVPC